MRGLLQLLAAHLIGGRGDAGITRGEVWLEALKIVNARRDYYGRLFWQLPTITVSATNSPGTTPARNSCPIEMFAMCA